MKHLSPGARKRLSENPWVEKITQKQVHFTPAFKIKALELADQGQLAPEIFRDHGINVEDFKPEYFGNLLRKWKDLKREAGDAPFLSEQRGRKQLSDSQSLNDLTYEELKVIIATQEEIISLLKKKRALALKK